MASGDGDARLALELLGQARQLVESREYPATFSWLVGRVAEESASLGTRSAITAFDDAIEAYGAAAPDRERVWTRFLDRNRMIGFGVSTYARLGLADPALELVDGSMVWDGDDQDKKRSMVFADVANALVQRGDLDRGIALAEQALVIATKTECSSGIDRLVQLRPHLSRYSNVPAVAQLDEQLQTIRA